MLKKLGIAMVLLMAIVPSTSQAKVFLLDCQISATRSLMGTASDKSITRRYQFDEGAKTSATFVNGRQTNTCGPKCISFTRSSIEMRDERPSIVKITTIDRLSGRFHEEWTLKIRDDSEMRAIYDGSCELVPDTPRF